MRPLFIDNFAGGGGASSGIEAAIGRSVDVAINHDPEAVAMHAANHPGTAHYCQSIMAVDPLDATGGRAVALAWFSPDCKHHSKAKGGKPREKNIRDLAWVVVHWAERLLRATPDGRGAPQVIMLENVEEFRQWGPLDADGIPIKERKGEEFQLWMRRLRRCGYKVEWRELRACDYGAPTSRKRLYLIARRDGRPIVWPKPTHGRADSDEVRAGALLPWRTAAECIDWPIPCPSIFDRKRPLKPATLRRIAHGTMRYVVNAAEPFIVPVTHSGGGNRAHGAGETLRTITTANGGEFAAVDAKVAPVIVGCGGRRGQSGPVDPAKPYPTTTAKADACLVSAFLHKYRKNSVGASMEDPVPTVTANSFIKRPGGAPPISVATAFLSHFYTSNTNGGRGDPEQPAKAVTAEGQHHSVVCAHMEQANTGATGHDMRESISTIVGKGCAQRLVETTMIDADALPADQLGRAVEVAAFLIKYYGNESDGHGLAAPIGTVTTKDRFAVVTVTIDAVTYVIVDIGMRMLTRRELANAQGFSKDYILDPIGPNGKPLSISASIRMIGNSVCPDVAEALVRANLPEHCVAANDERAEAAA